MAQTKGGHYGLDYSGILFNSNHRLFVSLANGFSQGATMEKKHKKSWGGLRIGAGRPTLYKEKMKTPGFYLSQEQITWLEKQANQNAVTPSAILRKALDNAMQRG